MATFGTFVLIIILIIIGAFIYDTYLTNNTEENFEKYRKSDPIGAAKIERPKTAEQFNDLVEAVSDEYDIEKKAYHKNHDDTSIKGETNGQHGTNTQQKNNRAINPELLPEPVAIYLIDRAKSYSEDLLSNDHEKLLAHENIDLAEFELTIIYSYFIFKQYDSILGKHDFKEYKEVFKALAKH